MKKMLDPSPARAAAYCAFYPMLHAVAKRHGYALAVHGSFHRDCDMIAVPWVEGASEPLKLIKAMKKVLGAVTHHEEGDKHFPDCHPTEKPHGRLAYSLHVTNHGMYAGYFDVSIMPRGK